MKMFSVRVQRSDQRNHLEASRYEAAFRLAGEAQGGLGEAADNPRDVPRPQSRFRDAPPQLAEQVLSRQKPERDKKRAGRKIFRLT